MRLKALKDCAYDRRYHSKMQGFFYSLLKESGFETVHDKKGYKHFCFSNIYPIDDVHKGDVRHLIFSSPDAKMADAIRRLLEGLAGKETPLNIGELYFLIERVSLLNTKVHDGVKVVSATPVVIRIPEKNYDLYSVPSELRKKNYTYWRPSIDFSAFVKQLNENLFKKYGDYYKTDTREFPLFSQFRFRKPVAVHIIEEGREYPVIGSLWEFSFPFVSEDARKILEFGIDAGFGERNSLGFGFVNILRR